MRGRCLKADVGHTNAVHKNEMAYGLGTGIGQQLWHIKRPHKKTFDFCNKSVASVQAVSKGHTSGGRRHKSTLMQHV